jgi:hypothetical protein
MKPENRLIPTMPNPFPSPEIGTKPHLYRLIRDTLYFPAGTVMCLTPDQVLDYHHERVTVECDCAERIAVLTDRLAELEDKCRSGDQPIPQT